MSTSTTPLPHRNLDTIRTIAVLAVVVDHLAITLLPRGVREPMALLGRFGVLLFFVHTSLVLMSSIERHGLGPRWVASFYLRRAFRIYPLLIVTVGLVLVFHIPDMVPDPRVVQHASPPTTAIVVANLLLIQDFWTQVLLQSPFWSLPVEVQMYVILPFAFLATQRGWRMVALTAFLLEAYWFVAHAPVVGAWHYRVFRFGPCFLAGVIAFYLLRRGVRGRWSPWALIGMVTLAFVTMFYIPSIEGTTVRNWIPCLIVGVAIPWFRDARPTWLTPITKTICTYSFGIYLLHLPVMWLVFGYWHKLPVAEQVPLFMVLLSATSYVAYWSIEHPATELGKRLAARLEGRATVKADMAVRPSLPSESTEQAA